jgi:glycosyltransferase 2 family protein
MRKKILNIFQYVIFLGLGIFLVWLTVKDITPTQYAHIMYSIKNARHWLFIPVLGMLLLAHFSRAIRWKILMEPLGCNPSVSNTFYAVMIGYLANLPVPRLGEVLKCTILGRYEKIPADKLVGTIVAERAFDVLCLLIVITITILTQIDTIGVHAKDVLLKIVTNDKGEFSPIKIVILLAILAFIVVLFAVLFTRFRDNKIISRMRSIWQGIYSGLTSFRKIKNRGWFVFHTIFIWCLYLAATWLGLYALHETGHLGIKPALSVLTFGSLGMIATQGGIGAYQYAVQKVLLLYGVAEEFGLASGWLLWSAQTAIVLVVGLLCLVLLPLSNRKRLSHA